MRTATEADHLRVLAVLDDWWAGNGPRALAHRLFFEHFAGTSLIVDRPDGTLAAFLVGFLSQSRPEVAYVHLAGVAPDLRRTGLGARLYQAFFDIARAHGRTTVECVTSPGNTGSVGFHTRLGFEVTVQPDHGGPGVPRIAFTRRL
jgi:predicted GNAT superfamily acetyltransferase